MKKFPHGWKVQQNKINCFFGKSENKKIKKVHGKFGAVLGLGNITKRYKIKMLAQIRFKPTFIPCSPCKPFEPPFNLKLPKFREEFES